MSSNLIFSPLPDGDAKWVETLNSGQRTMYGITCSAANARYSYLYFVLLVIIWRGCMSIARRVFEHCLRLPHGMPLLDIARQVDLPALLTLKP